MQQFLPFVVRRLVLRGKFASPLVLFTVHGKDHIAFSSRFTLTLADRKVSLASSCRFETLRKYWQNATSNMTDAGRQCKRLPSLPGIADKLPFHSQILEIALEKHTDISYIGYVVILGCRKLAAVVIIKSGQLLIHSWGQFRWVKLGNVLTGKVR